MAFEAADGFELGFALGVFASEVGAGLGVGVGAGESDDVDRAVELAVPAAVQSVALGVAAAGRDGGGAGVPGEVPVAGKALRAGGVADDDRGGDGSAAGLGEQLGSVRVDQASELGEQLALRAADLGDPLKQPSCDPQPRGLGQPGELAGQPGADPWALSALPGVAGLPARVRS